MKILAVSDRVMEQLYCVEVRQKYPDVDLIVGCGDLPFYYLDFLISALDRRLVYVRGNHDKGPQYTIDGRILEQVQGGDDIHGRSVLREELLLAGLEGSMRYRPGAPFMYSEAEMRYQVAQLLPLLLKNKLKYGRFLDILVAHSPPFGIHDKPDLPHTGFKIMRNLLQWVKPKLMLHGHIHIYRRDTVTVSKFEETTIINVYPYRIIDFNNLPEPQEA
ncbi:MAG: metallophosphoesterase family protein [Ardenticatenaceae bacterium]|nr:metallophosphoesterase family protein [Anaerolineales bacterium]MCB8940296.1 metallophosphoesterase family protein [Ardenticatenaceae bacterium]MCB8973311.1 metallophosphoesterase family protein [Ardenticatenaceae bacterium]